MKSGRLLPFVLGGLALLLGLGAVAFLRNQAAEEAALAALDAALADQRTLAHEASAAAPAVELEALPEEPAPEADATSIATRSEARTARLELEVVDAAALPVPGARVFLFREETLLAHGTSDGAGVVPLPAGEGQASFAVRLAGVTALRGETEISAGRRTLTLPQGSQLAGRVTVDGGLPPRPIELTWRPGKRGKESPELPKAVLQLVLAPGSAREGLEAAATTDAHGAFAFRWLPRESAGSLRWSGPYLLEGTDNLHSSQRLEVPEPRTDLQLKLVEGLEIVLRIVDPAGAPLSQGRLMVRRELKRERGSRSSSTSMAADASGVVRWTLGKESFTKLVLEVSAKDSSGAKSYEYAWPTQSRGTWDLGDLAVRATRSVTLHVEDASGAPIQGASAYPWPTSVRTKDSRTDQEGKLTLSVPSDGDGLPRLAVEAFEFRTLLLPVPLESTQLTAVLTRAPTLEFSVNGQSDSNTSLALELSGPTPLFGDSVHGTDQQPPTPRSSSGSWSSSTEDEIERFELEPEKSGKWRISGLVPGVTLHAALKSSGQSLSEMDIPPLQEGERRAYAFDLPGGGQPVRLRVLSPDGTPVAGARVWLLGADNGSYRSVGTDAEGRAEVAVVYGGRCTLLVTAERLAPKTLRLSPIPVGIVDVRLEPPRTVELELVDPAGLPFTASAFVRVGTQGPGLAKALPQGGGRYRLEGLPHGFVQLEVWAAELGSSTLIHDTSVPFARMVVGEKCSVLVTVKGNPSAPQGQWAVAIAVAGSNQPLARNPLEAELPETGAHFAGLAAGSYEVWLEQLDPDSPEENWVRHGTPKSAAISASAPTARVELEIP